MRAPMKVGKAFPRGLGVPVHSGLLWADVPGVAFPGSFAYDVPYQLRQAVTGAYSTHHPLLHTLLLGGLLQLGRALGDIDIGAAIYTAVQMALAGRMLCADLRLDCAVSPARARQSARRSFSRSIRCTW